MVTLNFKKLKNSKKNILIITVGGSVPWREKVTKIEAFFDDIKMFLPKWQNCAFNFLTLSLFLEREAWKWMFFFYGRHGSCHTKIQKIVSFNREQ